MENEPPTVDPNLPPTLAAEIFEPKYVTSKSVKRSARILWGLMLSMIVAIGVLSWLVIFQPPPNQFEDAQMITPLVRPTGRLGLTAPADGYETGTVRMFAVVRAPQDPVCIVSTQFFVRVSDGGLWKLPGARWTGKGETTRAVYEAPVPLDAPKGPAIFYVLDTYSCGVRVVRMRSPELPFVIGETGAQ